MESIRKDEQASKSRNENTDLFLSMAGCEAVKKIMTMAYPKELEELTYENIVRIMEKHIRPKQRLVVPEKTKFMETRQDPNKPVI